MTKNATLRFAILCDSLKFPKWQADCLREVINAGLAKPVLIVMKSETTQHSFAPKRYVLSKFARRRFALWRIFNRLYVDRVCRATRTEDLSDYLAGIPILQESPIPSGTYGECFSTETIDIMKSQTLDFTLRLGFGILKGEVLRVARFGVWSYHHGDPAVYRGQPPGFWEMYDQSPITGSILQVLNEDLDAGKVLYQGFFQTTLHSYAKTRDTIYAGSSSWVRRMCAEILANDWPLASTITFEEFGPIYKEPDNHHMVRFLLKVVSNFFKTQIKYRLYRQKWNCGVVPCSIEVVSGLKGASEQLKAIKSTDWMSVERNAFVADPFGVKLPDGSIRMFFERLKNGSSVASIATCKYSKGQFEDVQTVINAPTHLSYPFIWRECGVNYIIPENSAAKNVSAFKFGNDGQTEGKITLLNDMDLIDTTFIEVKGKIWAFALIDGVTKNSELHIFYSDKITGPWKAHILNPVKTDISNARPAGTMFWWEGKLYRPAQDCSIHYGYAINVNEIRLLNDTEFHEVPVCRVEPLVDEEYTYGLHTMSQVGNLTLIDCAKKEFIFSS